MATRRVDAPTRAVDAVVFDLVLLAFVGTLVAVALLSLDPRARLVPLIIGVPTLTGLVVQLLLDLFPRLRPRPPADGGTDGGEADDGEADDGEADDGEAEHAPRRTRRQLVFAGWAIGFVALTAIGGLLVSIPVALLFFFKVVNRESWRLSLALTAGTWSFLYALFGIVLGVRF